MLKKATAAGVKFSWEQLAELCLICEEEALTRAIQFSSDRFTAEDLDALYCTCDDGILTEIAKKRGIRLPDDIDDCEDAELEAQSGILNSAAAQNRRKYCPDCGRRVDSNFCPDCGADLRKTVIPQPDTDDYSSYLRFYPYEIEAIQALRIDTGLNAVEAKKIIDRLFDAKVFPMGSASQQTGMRAVDAGNAIGDTFRENEAQKEKESQETLRSATKAVGKGIGLAALFSGFGLFRIVSGLVKPYMGRRK